MAEGMQGLEAPGAASPRAPSRARGRFSGDTRILMAPLLIVVLGCSLSAVVWIAIRDTAAMRDRVRFEIAVEREIGRLTDRMRNHATLMRGASALFSANAPEPVTAEKFAAYVSRLNIDLNYPGIQGIGFSLRLRDDSDTAAVLASARRRAPELELRPRENGERHAIVFIEPLDARNRMALGFDMFSDPLRRAAMEQARDTATPVLTARVTLVQEIAGQRHQAGFLMYVPVYRGRGVPDSVDARRSRLDGYVYSPFRAEDLLSRIYTAGAESREVSLAIHDGPAPTPETLMYQTDADDARGTDGPLRMVVPIDVAGHRWTAVAAARPPFQRLSSANAAPAAALAGIAATLMLATLAWSQARATRNAQRARDEVRAINESLEQRIATRTRELEIARGALEATNTALEATVARRTLQLRDSINEAQRFVYVASHDLRAPLVNIVGFAGELEVATKRLHDFIRGIERARPDSVPREILAVLDNDIPEALSFIHGSTGRMDRLIATILKLAREERRTLNPEILSLHEILTSVVDGLRTQIDAAGAEVIIAPGLPEIVGDRVAVEQIFANLVENAVKYLDPARPGRVELRGRTEGARVAVEVEDNGRGIDPQDHERVFQLFRRAGVPDRPGEGLGLAFVRALVRRLDGEIALRSTPGAGSVFTVSLPRILTNTAQENPDGR
jgi:signal transduction histidine kinase